jgi:hypothetical protein
MALRRLIPEELPDDLFTVAEVCTHLPGNFLQRDIARVNRHETGDEVSASAHALRKRQACRACLVKDFVATSLPLECCRQLRFGVVFLFRGILREFLPCLSENSPGIDFVMCGFLCELRVLLG